MKKTNEPKRTGNKIGVVQTPKEESLFYKFDDEYLVKEAEFVTTFKLPLKEKELENIENKNEPIYKAIAIISMEKFNNIVDHLLKVNTNSN